MVGALGKALGVKLFMAEALGNGSQDRSLIKQARPKRLAAFALANEPLRSASRDLKFMKKPFAKGDCTNELLNRLLAKATFMKKRSRKPLRSAS